MSHKMKCIGLRGEIRNIEQKIFGVNMVEVKIEMRKM